MRMSGELKNSPSIGVLVSRRVFARLRNQNPSTEIRYLTKANEEVHVVLFFFAISSVDRGMKKIEGMFLDVRTNWWKKDTFSIPNVLYIRGGGDQQKLARLVNKVRASGMVVNYPRFDKWQVFQGLNKHENIKEYLPDTVLYGSENDLHSMLDKYGIVYLKPLRGRKGRNVIRLMHDGSCYKISYYIDRGTGKGVRKLELNNYSSVAKFLTRIYGGNKFLIQQAIDLMTIGDRLVDLRAEMLRNTDGVPDIIAVSARIGGSNSPITTHASAVSLDYYTSSIGKYLHEDKNKIEQEIRQFLVTIYHSIEVYFGKYGEMGIDFGIDQSGKIWFIECNSQSAKVSLAKAYGNQAVYKSYLGVLNYAKHSYRRLAKAHKKLI